MYGQDSPWTFLRVLEEDPKAGRTLPRHCKMTTLRLDWRLVDGERCSTLKLGILDKKKVAY